MLPSPRPLALAPRHLVPLIAAALFCAACSKSSMNLMPDEPPTVTLTSGPVDTVSAPQSWLVDIAWTASDPDGRIDHYEYAIDPPRAKQVRFGQAETAWVSTHETHVVARFRATHPDSVGPGATASDFHVFVLRAIDDRHVASPTVVRAFYAYTIAPDVRFTDPAPNVLLRAKVGNPFRLSWTGNDPDGAGTNQPVAYRLRFLSLADPGNTLFLSDPDSLRRVAMQTNWADWRTVAGDTTSILVNQAELQAGTYWLVAIVAVDQAGATTPYLMTDRNLLAFEVLSNGGPSVHVFSPFIDYTTPPASQAFSPQVEVPAGQSLSFNLEGIASAGRHITGTRWALDIASLDDETPRSNEDTDLAHWSKLHAGVSTAAFSITGDHQLAVETFDDLGASAILLVRLSAIVIPLDHDLLVVDDTRLEVDKFSGGCSNLYTQPWPSRAEMDTFLFARGGVPWRCARNPADALSPPGLLAGYSFDTLGTRLGLENPASAVSFDRLSRYRHVLWLLDQKSAQNLPSYDHGLFPITTLYAMCTAGRANVLAEYVRSGGQVWLAGGGAAYASLISFNSKRNDTCGVVFANDAGELVPGRLMFDEAHVRSAIGVEPTSAEPARSAAARGGWSGHGPDGTLSAPDYSRLPAQLHLKIPDTDPIPPTRLAFQGSLFYRANAGNEFVVAPNSIVENFGPSGGERLESALDTLYEVSSTQLCVSPAPAMLYYHGRENTPFVFTGFDLWSWSRADCQALVDFVLGDIWKLPKSGAAARPASASGAIGQPARAPKRVWTGALRRVR